MKSEQILEVRKWGNSAGILVPREWLNGMARVELITKPLNIKKEVMKILDPYLEEIIGIYLVGSYARGEQEEDSDIDIIAIANKIQKIIKLGKYNIQILTMSGLQNMLLRYPITIMPSMIEAKTILNGSLLEKIRRLPFVGKDFLPYLRETGKMIKKHKELIELDSKKSNEILHSGVIYSVILRLRGVYIIKCYLDKKRHSKSGFLRWLKLKAMLSDEKFETAYSMYKEVRDDKKVKTSVSLDVARKLVDALEKEVNKFEKRKKT